MDWVVELRQSFRRLLVPGAEVAVRFADRQDTVGEVGREFNALAAELALMPPNGLSRERAHGLRNRLAGLLAALHLLKDGGTLTAEQQGRLNEVVEEARALDTSLRARGQSSG